MVPVVAQRHEVSSVEDSNVSNDFRDHTPKAISDGHNTSPIEFGRLDVQHVVDPSIRHAALEDIQSCEFAGFLDSKATLHQQLQQRPVPEGVRFDSLSARSGSRFAVVLRASCQRRNAKDRRLGISRSRSRILNVMRLLACILAFSNPTPRRSLRCSGTTRGASRLNGESDSVAHSQISAKNVRTWSSQA